jgi:hypothetical protein
MSRHLQPSPSTHTMPHLRTRSWRSGSGCIHKNKRHSARVDGKRHSCTTSSRPHAPRAARRRRSSGAAPPPPTPPPSPPPPRPPLPPEVEAVACPARRPQVRKVHCRSPGCSQARRRRCSSSHYHPRRSCSATAAVGLARCYRDPSTDPIASAPSCLTWTISPHPVAASRRPWASITPRPGSSVGTCPSPAAARRSISSEAAFLGAPFLTDVQARRTRTRTACLKIDDPYGPRGASRRLCTRSRSQAVSR